jgi:hypothetical protein
MTDTIIVTPSPAVQVTVTAPTTTSTSPSNVSVFTGTPGPTGPVGPAGPTGPTGPQGPGSGSLTFTQNAVSTTWTITHALGYYPSVTTTDSAGTVIEGTISYPSITSVVVTFGIATSGFAYLS